MAATVTAFTVPLIYISNKQFIDEQLKRASEIVNAQVENTKQLTGKYAEDAAVRARATAAELQSKVHSYTHTASPVQKTEQSVKNGNKVQASSFEFPKTPDTEPASTYKVNEPILDEPIMA